MNEQKGGKNNGYENEYNLQRLSKNLYIYEKDDSHPVSSVVFIKKKTL